MTFRFPLVALLAFAIVTGCSSSTTPPDTDGGHSGTDLGPGHDGGPGTDGGPITFDAGPGTDAGPGVDLGPGRDGGPGVDGGPMPTIMGSVGSACTMDSDCSMLSMPMCEMMVGGGGFGLTFPGGYCTQPCGGTGGAMCPMGSQCFAFGTMGMCAKTCTSDADCRTAEGYTCMSPPFIGGGPYCLPPMGGGGDAGMPFP